MHFKDNIAAEESNAESDKKEICMENEMADKLDVLMEILFSYFHDITHLNGEIQTFESACFWFYKLWHDWLIFSMTNFFDIIATIIIRISNYQSNLRISIINISFKIVLHGVFW